MKKLLSLALVLTMLFTIIAVPSVSAADAKDDYLVADFKTVMKAGFETGDPVPKKASGQSYNIFTMGAKDPDGTAFASNFNTTPSGTTYESNSITAPVAEGETFGSNVIKIDFRNKNIGSYTSIRGRFPFSISETCTVTAGKIYRLSAWVRLDEFAVADATSGLVGLKIGDDINTDVAAADCVTLQKGQWRKVVTEFSPSATLAKSNCVILTIRGTSAPILAYVDNIRIEELQETKTGSQVVAYTAIGAASGTPYGTGTDVTYKLATGSSNSIDATLAETYASNSNTSTFPTANELYNENSPVYYPHMPAKIFKKTSTNGAWLVRLSNAFNAADLAEGDKVRISMDVYNTDAVAHAKLKDGTMGAATEIDTQRISMYPTGGASATDMSASTYSISKDVPVDTWYRLEKVFTVPSAWAATGVRLNTRYTQKSIEAFNQPFASTTYFTNFKYEKITDTSAKVNVGVSSEIAGLTVTGAGEYNVGSNATVTAPEFTADNSKKFKGWYDGYVCVSTDASYTFTAVTPVNLVAKYETNYIDVKLSTLGEGSVDGECEVTYGEEVTVTATADEGYVFEGWYDNATNVIVSRDAEYTFAATLDTELYAYFIPAAVDNYNLLAIVDAEDGWNPSTSHNFWGKDPSTDNGNSGDMAQIVTYEDEAENISKPNDTEDFGSMLIKADKANQSTATTGVGTFRINGIEGIRYNAGDTYKMSAWMYVAQMDDTTKTEVTVPMNVVYNAGGSQMQDTKTVTVPVGEWTKVESIFTVAEDSALIGKATTGWRASLGAYVTVMYMDNFKIEKFDGVTVSAEATNGTVYGTGSYAKGASVTLNAGADAGYKFAGYYTKDTDTLISANPTYTFTANADTTIVAKFVQEDAFTYPSNVIYHFGSEEGDVGINNNWIYIGGKQNSNPPYNNIITYKELAADGIYKPYESAEFGANLYQQKNLEGTLQSQVSGRFRGWENGSNGVSTKYKAGHAYKFTWWVYPVSMQLANGETAQPATTKLSITMTYNGSNESELGTKTWTLNVGQWNKLEWEFQATETMTTIAPGLRYDWESKKAATNLITAVNWALYDEIQVEEITTWQFGDTKTPSGWVCRGGKTGMDTEFHGTAKDNESVMHVETYEKIGVDKASEDAGDHLFVFDTARPNAPESEYNPTEGSIFWPEGGEKMSYEDAYALYSSYDTLTGDLAGRFNNIASAGILEIGKTYKISLKVYIDEIRNIEEEGCPLVTDATNKVIITGTHTGSTPVGDGKQVSKVVAQDTWTEISYTFKATEAGATYAPSLRIDFSVGDHTKFPTLVYVDDVRVDQIHVDDLDLVIEDGETEVTATATVYDIKDGDTVDAIVIIAGYDADGKLVSVSFSNNGASKALAINETLSAKYTKAETVDSYVAFLWDDLTNIRPYVLPVPLSTEVTE